MMRIQYCTHSSPAWLALTTLVGATFLPACGMSGERPESVGDAGPAPGIDAGEVTGVGRLWGELAKETVGP